MLTVETFELPGAHTNNQAEYLALIKLLEDEALQDAQVYMDSQIVVGHLTQTWKVCRNLRQFKQRAASIIRQKNITISKVDRKVMVALLGH
jgi:ribonuclease HI